MGSPLEVRFREAREVEEGCDGAQSPLPTSEQLAELLTRVTRADAASTEALHDVLYKELRRIARLHMQGERQAHTLQPTALANEVYLRLAGGAEVSWAGRAHFLAVASRAMRAILVDHARRKGAQKRGGDRVRVPLTEAVQQLGGPELDILDVESALEALGDLDARKVQVVEMRFYAGMSSKEIAEVLGVSAATVQDDWYAARAWLRTRLGA